MRWESHPPPFTAFKRQFGKMFPLPTGILALATSLLRSYQWPENIFLQSQSCSAFIGKVIGKVIWSTNPLGPQVLKAAQGVQGVAG